MITAAARDAAHEWLSPAQAAKLFPPTRNGRPTHPATVTRWFQDGVPVPDGSRLRCRATRFPGGWRTRREWINEFLDALTRARLGVAGDVEAQTAPDARRVEAMRDKLAALGVA